VAREVLARGRQALEQLEQGLAGYGAEGRQNVVPGEARGGAGAGTTARSA